MRTIKRRNGALVEVDDGYVLANGEAYIVPLHLMDSSRSRGFTDSRGAPSGQRPGFLFRDDGSEADLDRAHREYREGISERWKSDRWQTPTRPVPARAQMTSSDGSQASLDDAYREYNETIANRWRR